MRKLHNVVIVVAAAGALSTIGAGVSFADGYGYQGGGPQVTAWATSQSAAGASAQGAYPHHEMAPQQPAPQYYAPQAPAPQQPAPQYYAPQAPAPQPAPQQPAPQVYAPQAPAPQQPAPQSWPGKEKGKETKIKQSTSCRTHDLNVNILGQVGLLNGVLGNALNGEGHPGKQSTRQGSSLGCNNTALAK
ncbi:hypothetical protein [Streptomyces chattanoogensis]|uniref:hypothetical protein n=1 Tax=Streptomyces chattanoogensis TaxID=66876 RepID=UPI0006B66A31|nr:hypothetical protein [Streptomyces chattanoogensis]